MRVVVFSTTLFLRRGMKTTVFFVLIVSVEVIRCIKRENAWIKCKVQNIYI